MTDDQYLLASVYADDAASSDERAQAEADPEVMAEVARIRELQAALADVEPAQSGLRSSAIAAAMARFDDRPPITVAAAASARRAFPWARSLSVAAAAVAVLAIGAVALDGTRGGDGDDSAASTATEMADATEAPMLMTEGDADQRVATTEAADMYATEAADGATIAGGDGNPAAAAPVEGEPAATDAAAGTEAPGTEAPMATLGAPPVSPVVIETDEQLAAVGLGLRDAYEAGVVGPNEPVTDCTPATAFTAPGADESAQASTVRQGLPASAERIALLDTRDYRAPGGVIAVYVAVDLDSAQTYAIDAAHCVLVGVGTAP